MICTRSGEERTAYGHTMRLMDGDRLNCKLAKHVWPDDLQKVRAELVDPFWEQAARLGFQFAERVEEEDRRYRPTYNFLERGLGGPARAHFIEVDGSIFREPQGTQAGLWSARFLTYVRIPEMRLLRTHAFFAYGGTGLRADALICFLAGARPANPVDRRPGAASVEEVWAVHAQHLQQTWSPIAPEGDAAGAWDKIHDEFLSQFDERG